MFASIRSSAPAPELLLNLGSHDEEPDDDDDEPLDEEGYLITSLHHEWFQG